jgi:SAM-dependent methyltransferase
LYERHWWWRSREAAVLGVLRRHLGEKHGIKILDVGCGDGLFFGALAEFGDVEGVEFSEALLDPKGPYRSRIHVAPFDKDFQPGRAYDLILMLDVLEHLPNAEGALQHASSLLARDGALLLTVPAFQILWTNHDVINHHLIRYRRKTLRPLLEKSGLAVVDERYWYQWTCPVKLAQRAVEKILQPKPKPPSVPPSWMNGLLYRVTRLEQETLGAWGAPFGSSLMAYCRIAGKR